MRKETLKRFIVGRTWIIKTLDGNIVAKSNKNSGEIFTLTFNKDYLTVKNNYDFGSGFTGESISCYPYEVLMCEGSVRK